MKHFLLFYDVVDDYAARRTAHRDAHLHLAWAAHGRGELVLAGALAEPLDGALLLFQGPTPEVAESFARNDPYVMNGLVVRWFVREWTTVVGDGAVTPVSPSETTGIDGISWTEDAGDQLGEDSWKDGR